MAKTLMAFKLNSKMFGGSFPSVWERRWRAQSQAVSASLSLCLMLAEIFKREISETRGNDLHRKCSLSIGKEWPWGPATSPTHWRGRGCPQKPDIPRDFPPHTPSSHLPAPLPAPRGTGHPAYITRGWRENPPLSSPLLQSGRILVPNI